MISSPYSKKCNNKKAQMAIFMIIGLILVIAIGISVYLASTRNVDTNEAIEETISKPTTITEFVERCVYDTAVSGAGLIALQGGVIYSAQADTTVQSDTTANVDAQAGSANNGNLDELGFIKGEMLNMSTIDVDAIVRYGYYDDQNVLVPVLKMESDLENYLADALPLCLNNFEAFPVETVETAKTAEGREDITATVEIVMDKIIVDVNYPITYGTTTIDEFIVEVPVRLGYMHALADAVIEKQILDPDNIDFTFLSDLSQGYLDSYNGDVEVEENDEVDLGWVVEEDAFADYKPEETSPELEVALSNIPKNYALSGKIDIIPVKENNLVLVINDSNVVFMSAFKFVENKHPKLVIGEEYKLMDEEPFVLLVEVEDDDLVHKFEDDTYLFDITNEGMISFTPEIPGTYDVQIKVIDPHGHYDTRLVRFIVEEN